jgi:hypothetical protein
MVQVPEAGGGGTEIEPTRRLKRHICLGLFWKGLVTTPKSLSAVAMGVQVSIGTHLSNPVFEFSQACNDPLLRGVGLARAGIRRVKGVKKLGVRLGNWLTAEEARRLWQAPDPETLKGKRDRAIPCGPAWMRAPKA